MFEPQKTPKIYECKICNFVSCNLKDYNRHLNTRKHQITIKYNLLKSKNPKPFQCVCGKAYPYRASLYNHQKKCITCKNNENIEDINDENSVDYKEMFLSMIKENSKLCSTIVDQQKQINTSNTSNISKVNNTNNINNPIIGDNNTINKNKIYINIFLNEQCKDALTMNEFINKINITLDDLTLTKDKGIIEGVSNIFIENMNKLSLYQRPVHCTDMKRETVYIKCDNVEDQGTNWEQDVENIKLKDALKKVSLVQQKNLDKWTKEHPNWMNSLEQQEEYMQLVKNCTDDIQENKRGNKAIKKVCSNVYLSDTFIDS